MPTAQDKAADPAACGPIVPPSEHIEKKASVAALALGSIGVVYGDIGTSPLYALRESIIHSDRSTGLTEHNVIGTVSLLLWALFFIVTAKYVLFLMRADNKGEGGTLSLMALAQSAFGRRAAPIFFLGVAGAALFSGDAIITPAISVLSALEGLQIGTPVFSDYVAAADHRRADFRLRRPASWHGESRDLFRPRHGDLFRRHRSARGNSHPGCAAHPARLQSVRRRRFLSHGHGFIGFLVLGSVFLAVTGAEALYADMGHFGRRPIQPPGFSSCCRR